MGFIDRFWECYDNYSTMQKIFNRGCSPKAYGMAIQGKRKKKKKRLRGRG